MKSLRKILAVLVATAMVAGMGVMAFGDPTNNMMAYDGSLEVQGLVDGATVTFYQILKWDQSHSGTGGWVIADGYNGTMTDPEIVALIGSGTNPTPGITYEKASAIASKLKNGSGVTVSGGKAVYNIANKSGTGLYVAVITPANTEEGVIYNPVFVSSNWYKSGTSGVGHNVWDLSGTSGTSGSYYDNPKAVAKKKTLTLNKKITEQTNDNDSGTAKPSGTIANLEPDAPNSVSHHTANKGDVITFEITSSIPTFGKNYVNPTYIVTDTLDGLKLSGTPVVYKSANPYSGTLDVGTYYTYSGTTSGYTLTFLPNVLWRSGTTGINAGPQDIYIVYQAVVDPSGTNPNNVNEKDNKVTIEYSNKPGEENSGTTSTLEDRTKNYVFSIDANVLGQGGGLGSGTEIVKVALDADGNEITSGTRIKVNSGTEFISPLQGATFEVKSLDNGNAFTDTVESDANGRINIEGIDAGWYSITETSAPDGYVKDSTTYYILIEPFFEKVDVVENGAHYKYDRLVSYDVYVGTSKDKSACTKTAHYKAFDNSGSTGLEKTELQEFAISNNKPIEKNDLPTSGSRAGKIQNTQGVALPSTGGVGTTLFYAGGAILVLLAGILLVSKRRIA